MLLWLLKIYILNFTSWRTVSKQLKKKVNDMVHTFSPMQLTNDYLLLRERE